MDDELSDHRLIGELATALAAACSGDQHRWRTDMRLWHSVTDLLHARWAIVRELLAAIASDPALAARVAGRSYWHSNGFAKLVLHRHDDPPFALRLHVWPDVGPGGTPPAGDSNMHGHRWSFGSVLLAGAFDVEQYAETRLKDLKAIPCRRFAYASPPGSPTGDLVADGPTALHCVRNDTYTAPDPHHCLVDTVHKVLPRADVGLTATFLVQGPVETDSALVYTPEDRAPIEDLGMPVLPREVTALVSQTLDAMAATPAPDAALAGA